MFLVSGLGEVNVKTFEWILNFTPGAPFMISIFQMIRSFPVTWVAAWAKEISSSLLFSSTFRILVHTTYYTANMKMTWKRSESSKKRPISHFPNLPFSDDASENLHVEVSSLPRKESLRNDDVQEKTTAAILDGDGDTLRLADSFQEQGNKLAEVKEKF